MPLASQASRPSKLSHERLGEQAGAAVAEVLEAQRLQGDAVGHALPGEGLHDPVRARRRGSSRGRRTPRRRGRPTKRQLPPVRASQWSIFVVDARSGRPSARTARGRCAPGAAAPAWPSKSRVMRMIGTFGSASMVASVRLVVVGAHDAVPSCGSSCCSVGCSSSCISASTASRRR